MRLSIVSALWLSLSGPLHGASTPEVGIGEKAGGRAEEEDGPMLVVLRENAAVHGPFVSLGDVAQLPNDPFRLRRYAGDLLLGFAPERGSMREIDAREVAARLREAGIAERRFLLKGAARTSVLPAEPTAQGTVAGRFNVPQQLPEDHPSTARPEARSTAPALNRPRRSHPEAPSEPVPVVLKDSRVVLRSVSRSLVIEEPGLALAAGAIGELIEVQNVRTSQRLAAKVVGKGEAIPQEPAAP